MCDVIKTCNIGFFIHKIYLILFCILPVILFIHIINFYTSLRTLFVLPPLFMDREHHFMPKSKLSAFVSTLGNEKITSDVSTSMQNLAEKFVSDIINRTILFTKHRGSEEITSEDIFFTVEKEFDFAFGVHQIRQTKNKPAEEHKEKLAEISKSK